MPELNKTILINNANLKNYYRMESGAITTDSSGNSQTLTNTAVTAVTGKYGDGGDFVPGSSSKLAVPYVNIGAAITYSAWFKTDITTEQSIIAFMNTWLRINRTSQGTIAYSPNQDTTIVTASTTINTGTWYHIAVTQTSTSYVIYFNGAVVGSGTTVAVSTTNGTINAIGNHNNTVIFDGILDDIAIFASALSADQIKELYEGRFLGELRPNQFGTTKALYHLSNETDYSENNFHLTNNNTATFPAGKFGNSVLIDRTNGRWLYSTTNIVATNDFTISCWIKPATTPSGASQIRGIYTERSTDTNSQRFRLAYETDGSSAVNLNFVVENTGATAYSATKAITLNTGQWYHLVAVCDMSNNEIRLFLDGALQDTTATTGTLKAAASSGTYRALVGAFYHTPAATYAFDGNIDELMIASSALTANQIRTMYALGKGLYV